MPVNTHIESSVTRTFDSLVRMRVTPLEFVYFMVKVREIDREGEREREGVLSINPSVRLGGKGRSIPKRGIA